MDANDGSPGFVLGGIFWLVIYLILRWKEKRHHG
jgi:hypothetical protein